MPVWHLGCGIKVRANMQTGMEEGGRKTGKGEERGYVGVH